MINCLFVSNEIIFFPSVILIIFLLINKMNLLSIIIFFVSFCCFIKENYIKKILLFPNRNHKNIKEMILLKFNVEWL